VLLKTTKIRTNIVTPDYVKFYLSKELIYWLWQGSTHCRGM